MSRSVAQVFFRFYEELNDFLAPQRYKRAFVYTFERRAPVKDAIEALGVPHTEVDLILVNGASVGFSQRLSDGDRVSVYPVFESLDITPLIRLRPKPLRRTRFVVDVNLGRLARYLRLLGFDTWYRNDYRDRELAELAGREGRILLTRDRRLLHHAQVTHGYFVRATHPQAQVREVFRRLDLYRAARPFHRCTLCNAPVAPVAKEAIWDRLPPKTRHACDEFQICRGCGAIYWKGSHYENMAQFVQEILAQRPLDRGAP